MTYGDPRYKYPTLLKPTSSVATSGTSSDEYVAAMRALLKEAEAEYFIDAQGRKIYK